MPNKDSAAANRLIHEQSPYLLQHAHNPVDWHPWGDEAFEKAKREDKPIFLSIGYATCHWCHVMAHESFEDKEVASHLNDKYISIKVDREERPDIDNIYMAACQTVTGQGGWPLSIFMDHDGKPFFAGTYFPKTGRMGMPGFMDILNQLYSLWVNERSKIDNAGKQIVNAIQPAASEGRPLSIPYFDLLKKGYSQLKSRFDSRWGGFGEAPKFPTPHNLTFLLRWHVRNKDQDSLSIVKKTLDAMRSGGIFDQVGFGFHRYSVDKKWLVPHFEKMLYDQALLAMAFIETFQVTGDSEFSEIAHEIFSYVLRDMVSPEGGFYSAEDADSEGKEGLFYVWTPDEIKEHLGEQDGSLFCDYFEITKDGNFEEGLSIPNIPLPMAAFSREKIAESEELENIIENGRKKLFDIREKRIHPLKDDKILTSWNGLMIAALAKTFQATGDARLLEAAKKALDFIIINLKDKKGRLLRRYRQGHAAYAAYLDDYAFMVWGLLELYEATFVESYLEEAINLNDDMIEKFWDKENDGLFFSGEDNEDLITRTKDVYDGALPSGNSVAVMNMLRLGRMLGRVDLEEKAEAVVKVFFKQVDSVPVAHTQLLGAIDFMAGPSREIVITGDPDLAETQEMINIIRRAFIPNKVLIFLPAAIKDGKIISRVPFLKEMKQVRGGPTVYICEQYSCKQPITELADLKKELKGAT